MTKSNETMDGWYYLHISGDLIYKPDSEDIVLDLRDSNFVRAFWPVNIKDRGGAWRILVESKSIGANSARILELAQKWGCDDKDAEIYTERIGISLSKDGDQYCATRKDFTNLQECPAGFGHTALDALSDLCKNLGFSPNKLNWHSNFHDLVK